MALTFDAIVDRLVGQFDVTTAVASAWVNERQNRMVAEAQWRMSKTTIATTVAGTSNYTLPENVVDLRAVRVEAANGDVGLYTPVGIEDLWKVDSGQSRIDYRDGGAGVFAEDYTSSGGVQIRLHPAPAVTGSTIVGLISYMTTDLTYGTGDPLVIPDDLRPFLQDGAMADGYTYEDERHDLAQLHEARFREGIELLRRRRNSRTGSGPGRMRVLRRR